MISLWRQPIQDYPRQANPTSPMEPRWKPPLCPQMSAQAWLLAVVEVEEGGHAVSPELCPCSDPFAEVSPPMHGSALEFGCEDCGTPNQ